MAHFGCWKVICNIVFKNHPVGTRNMYICEQSAGKSWIQNVRGHHWPCMHLQGRRKVWKSGRGAHSNVVGIIYPSVETGLTDLPKNWGGTAPSPLAPTAMNCIRVQHSDSSFSIINWSHFLIKLHFHAGLPG